jgi:hypothetical protein
MAEFTDDPGPNDGVDVVAGDGHERRLPVVFVTSGDVISVFDDQLKIIKKLFKYPFVFSADKVIKLFPSVI